MRSTIALAFVSLAVLATATPAPAPWTEPATPTTITVTAPAATATAPAGSCTSGPIQCCESMQKASSDQGQAILGLLNIILTDLDVLLGLTCSPITVIGVGTGNACTANTVCCENNNIGGLISIGCIPVII